MDKVEPDPANKCTDDENRISLSPEEKRIWQRANLWKTWLLVLSSVAVGIGWTIWLSINTGWSWWMVLVLTGFEAGYLFACLFMFTRLGHFLLQLMAWMLAGGSLFKSGVYLEADRPKSSDPKIVWKIAGCLGVGIAYLLVAYMNHKQ